MKRTKPVPVGPFARETLILRRRGAHWANSSLSCKMAHGYTAGRSRMPCPLRSWRWSVSIVPSPGCVADAGIAGRFRFHHLCNRRSRLAGSSGASPREVTHRTCALDTRVDDHTLPLSGEAEVPDHLRKGRRS
jgi:hypothetical protein